MLSILKCAAQNLALHTGVPRRHKDVPRGHTDALWAHPYEVFPASTSIFYCIQSLRRLFSWTDVQVVLPAGWETRALFGPMLRQDRGDAAPSSRGCCSSRHVGCRHRDLEWWFGEMGVTECLFIVHKHLGSKNSGFELMIITLRHHSESSPKLSFLGQNLSSCVSTVSANVFHLSFIYIVLLAHCCHIGLSPHRQQILLFHERFSYAVLSLRASN